MSHFCTGTEENLSLGILELIVAGWINGSGNNVINRVRNRHPLDSLLLSFPYTHNDDMAWLCSIHLYILDST